MNEARVEVARENMIEQQIRAWEVLDPRVLDVFATIPRESFVPERYRALAFADVAIPIGHGQTMMRPALEGRVLQALAPEPTDSVLEIGTGSGFLTACLAQLAANVLSIEIIEDLKLRAVTKLRALGVANVELRVGNAAGGWVSPRRFDVIAVTGSTPVVPETYRNQLTIGGRMFLVTGASPAMDAQLITRVGDAQWSDESLFETDLPRLLHAERRPEFAF